jgi:hypothetical protein
MRLADAEQHEVDDVDNDIMATMALNRSMLHSTVTRACRDAQATPAYI